MSFKSGYVAILGQPNVGKSTLLNAVVGERLSIVTQKPQTTRHRITGIYNDHESQIIFLDTPGIIKPRYLLQEAMMQFAGRAIADADVLLFMIDALLVAAHRLATTRYRAVTVAARAFTASIMRAASTRKPACSSR